MMIIRKLGLCFASVAILGSARTARRASGGAR